MTDKNTLHDSFRFSQETGSARLEEAKSRLIRDAENKAVETLVRLVGNGKLSEKGTEASLDQVDGPTSNSLIFSGKIQVHALADYGFGEQEISLDFGVQDSLVALPEDKDLMARIDEAKSSVKEPVIVTEDGVILDAGLDQFALQDDGSEFLTIAHPAAQDTAIGTVSKKEYATIEDKEAFFKDMLSHKFARTAFDNHFTLTFTGSFAEPKIERVAVEKIEEPEIEKKASQEPEVQPSVEIESDAELPLGRSADSFRQLNERQDLRFEIHRDKVVSAAANGLISHLRSLNYGHAKLGNVDATALTYSEAGFSGEINVSASIESADGLKVIQVPVTIANDSVAYPKTHLIADLVSKAVDIRSKLSEELAKEALSRIEAVNEAEAWKETETVAALEETKIEKTAADLGGTQYLGPMDTMKLSKHFLASAPEMEVGDVIFADGHHWKLIDKSSEQLSKGEDDASLWTFAKVTPSDKDPKESVGR